MILTAPPLWLPPRLRSQRAGICPRCGRRKKGPLKKLLGKFRSAFETAAMAVGDPFVDETGTPCAAANGDPMADDGGGGCCSGACFGGFTSCILTVSGVTALTCEDVFPSCCGAPKDCDGVGINVYDWTPNGTYTLYLTNTAIGGCDFTYGQAISGNLIAGTCECDEGGITSPAGTCTDYGPISSSGGVGVELFSDGSFSSWFGIGDSDPQRETFRTGPFSRSALESGVGAEYQAVNPCAFSYTGGSVVVSFGFETQSTGGTGGGGTSS